MEKPPFVYSVNEVAQQFIETDLYPPRLHRRFWGELLALLRPHKRDPRSFLDSCQTLDNPPLVLATLITRNHRLISGWSDAWKRQGLYTLTGVAALNEKNLQAAGEFGVNNWLKDSSDISKWSEDTWNIIGNRISFYEARQAQLIERQTPFNP